MKVPPLNDTPNVLEPSDIIRIFELLSEACTENPRMMRISAPKCSVQDRTDSAETLEICPAYVIFMSSLSDGGNLRDDSVQQGGKSQSEIPAQTNFVTARTKSTIETSIRTSANKILDWKVGGIKIISRIERLFKNSKGM